MNNINFKGVEFDTFRKEAGLNSFTLTPKKWIDATNAKGIISKPGKLGGTYAHKDIAFEFCTWLSPSFKLYLIQDYQRVKDIESNQHNIEWDVKRIMAKANYQLHTDAVKDYVIPDSKKWVKSMEYAEEADYLNMVVFGCTAKQWKISNPNRVKLKENIRDSASINELLILTNAESYNAQMIKDKLSKEERLKKLYDMVSYQRDKLSVTNSIKNIKKTSEDIYVLTDKKNKS